MLETTQDRAIVTVPLVTSPSRNTHAIFAFSASAVTPEGMGVDLGEGRGKQVPPKYGSEETQISLSPKKVSASLSPF